MVADLAEEVRSIGVVLVVARCDQHREVVVSGMVAGVVEGRTAVGVAGRLEERSLDGNSELAEEPVMGHDALAVDVVAVVGDEEGHAAADLEYAVGAHVVAVVADHAAVEGDHDADSADFAIVADHRSQDLAGLEDREPEGLCKEKECAVR